MFAGGGISYFISSRRGPSQGAHVAHLQPCPQVKREAAIRIEAGRRVPGSIIIFREGFSWRLIAKSFSAVQTPESHFRPGQ